MTTPPVVLVTGASTGIGRATAQVLAARGMRVLAGVRKTADGEAIASATITPLLLDVTQPDQIRQAVHTVADVAPQGLAGLVNNAGVAVSGPMEVVSLDEIRWQFEVNVFGLIAVTQALMPALRQARGRIVNIGSTGSRVSAPFQGPYCASKHALVAITNSTRQEVRPWGMFASLVEPGAIATPIWSKGRDTVASHRADPDPRMAALYPDVVDQMAEMVERQAAAGIPPERVAEAVHHALTARRPRTRYPVGNDAKAATLAGMYLPDTWMDAIIRRVR